MYDYGYSYGYGLIGGNTYNPLINYDWSTTTAKEYKTDGVELSSGLTSFALNWTNNQDGTYTSNGTSGRAFEMIEELGQTSKNYVVSFDVLSSVSGTLSLEFGSYSGTSLGLPIVKRYEIDVTEANSNDVLGFYSNSFIGTIGNISVQKVIEEPNKRYLKDVGSTPTYNASMYFGRGAYLNGVDQTITIPINITIQTALKRVNGVVDINETSQTLTNYVISGLGVHKDYYLFTRLLTTAEKDSYTNTPELFYAMAQADSTCVLNMPMCETDGYVRNMKSYSEGNELVTNGGFDTDSYWSKVGVAISNGVCNFTGTGQFVYQNKVVPSGYVLYELVVASVSTQGSLFVRAGKSTYTTISITTVGTYQIVLISDGVSEIVAYASGFTGSVDSVSVKQLTGAYPITNYTTSVRDNAKNLQYGLQTCKFVRDSLGVIQSDSDYLECDGVGYADTGWIPSATEDWSIETVLELPAVPPGAYNKYIGIGADIFIEQRNTLANSLKIKVWTTEITVTNLVGLLHSIILTSNGVIYLDATSVRNALPTKTLLTQSLYLGARNMSGVSTEYVNKPIRLFKVHNKVLTQEEITKNYNEYVAKGLLS